MWFVFNRHTMLITMSITMLSSIRCDQMKWREQFISSKLTRDTMIDSNDLNNCALIALNINISEHVLHMCRNVPAIFCKVLSKRYNIFVKLTTFRTFAYGIEERWSMCNTFVHYSLRLRVTVPLHVRPKNTVKYDNKEVGRTFKSIQLNSLNNWITLLFLVGFKCIPVYQRNIMCHRIFFLANWNWTELSK